MPPANSRDISPPADPAQRVETPPSYLSALRELESPVNSDVLNLAATLTTQAEDEIDTSTASYEWRVENGRERLRRVDERIDERERRERIRRIMSRLNHMNDPPAYSNRIPSQNNLYDWSPASEADDEEELDQILAELRREQPTTHPEILRVLGRSQLDAERESRMRAHPSRLLSSNQPSQSADSSLRSAAILQSVRRHPRFSARTREYMRVSDVSNNRPSHNSGTLDRPSPPPPAGMSPSERSRFEINRRQAALQRYLEGQSSVERNIRLRAETFRNRFLSQPSTLSSSSSSSSCVAVENSINYLANVRHSASEAESWMHALDSGILAKEYVYDKNGDRNPDFVIETASLPPPVEVSWLAPGAVLSGCQHAHTVTTTTIPVQQSGTTNTIYRFRNERAMSSVVYDATQPWQNNGQISQSDIDALNASNLRETVTTHSPQQDHWPVKVTIHAVDYDRMTLSATMEAYNVPSHPLSFYNLHNTSLDRPSPSVARTASITTYLEGEILDFNTYTLFTESFKSTPKNDATYWRKLPPFQKYTDDELGRKLVSRRWLVEELGRDWILMRWKERCFVKSLNRSTPDPQSLSPNSSQDVSGNSDRHSFTSSVGNHPADEQTFDDSGCGLTISGFYYVALKRSDGSLEGLYYDPQSSPYQHLKLESVNGGSFPAWSFR